MVVINLFNIRQGPFESIGEYLALLNEGTIKVIKLKYKVFIGAFVNGLREKHFNESLARGQWHPWLKW